MANTGQQKTNNADSAEDQSFINPFSIASRKDSDQNSTGQVTAEGFYKNPGSVTEKPSSTSVSRDETNNTMLSNGMISEMKAVV